ncbi:MAG: bifunctional fucokinase/fucose-1-phosphate guanylyltransferase [Kiritimatiellia bacterium]
MSELQVLLSSPPALVDCFQKLAADRQPDVFVSHDPPNAKLGSGGGSAHLLHEAYRSSGTKGSMEEWLGEGSRIMLHAGGQSRRLPAYAACGKALIPVPVFRWSTGQRLDQTLMDLQLPLLSKMLRQAPDSLRTIVASGDVLVWQDGRLPAIPEADVVCVGLWSSPDAATKHGVFFTPKSRPEQLEYMLQKPGPDEIQSRASRHLFLLDVGIWLFSDRAVEVLLRKCGWDSRTQSFRNGLPEEFDLYQSFGTALGRVPTSPDPEISALSCAVLPLSEAEFYHFGTSRDMIHSALALQNRIHDQRRIHSPLIKPHPAIFVQNAHTPCPMDQRNQNIWIENSCLGPRWVLNRNHVFTGVPDNDWELTVPEGICIDVVPLGTAEAAVRVYGFDDPFKGALTDPETLWMGAPACKWFEDRGLPLPEGIDAQQAALFPVCREDDLDNAFMNWLIHGGSDPFMRERFAGLEKISAEEIANRADLLRMQQLRSQRFVSASLPALARHSHRSVFYQVDLETVAEVYRVHPETPFPAEPQPDQDLFSYIHHQMFRSLLDRKEGSGLAFEALRRAIIDPYRGKMPTAHHTLLSDQVIWARSPVRLDLSGGWTDTPPYCFLHGGHVVNLAVELNGQPPIQVFARVGTEPGITLRSIDLGISQHLISYEEIGSYADLGSGFSIPKAALALAGFHPDFQQVPYSSLSEQLEEFGGGIELSLLCAVPKGSGLGTSSNLAATVLGALSELCGWGWDLTEIGNRSLALEQMLTSGGGWQDQFGGITRGLKYLKTNPGLDQTPEIRWLPDHLFTDPSFKENFLLYYTGITRVAKDILGEIVQGMFLNRQNLLETLEELRLHTEAFYETLQKGDFDRIGKGIARTWELNQQLDPGTNPPEIQEILSRVDKEILGCKLLGAGGGGYLLMMTRDAQAASMVRKNLEKNPPNPRARFVDFDLSYKGLQVTRS